MNWPNVLIAELSFVGTVILGLGFIKQPRMFRKKQLQTGFPWGYYEDQVPKGDYSCLEGNNTDFMFDTGTEFGGLDGFGDFGEFSGFGELGEYGATFFGEGPGGE